jgi:hypothetical protein
MEINIAYFIGLFFGALAVLVALFLIKKSKKVQKQFEYGPRLEKFYFNKNEDYTPTNFDREIFYNWAATYGEKDEDIRATMYGKDCMLEFAEYYHKAKS